MSSFLTVKEAAQRTGKSTSSIRRIIYPILKNDAHSDRTHIEPSVEDALKLRMKGENFGWRLSEELLHRAVPDEIRAEKGSTAAPGSPVGNANTELLAMLRRELEIKNQQITQQAELFAKQMELINGLGERLREGNILIGSLQQRLALTDGRQPAAPTEVVAKTKRPGATPPEKEKGSPAAAKSSKAKRGFFSRLFRP